MKVRYMHGEDHDEKDEYNQWHSLKKWRWLWVDVLWKWWLIQGRALMLYTNPMEWAKAAEDCLRIQEVWQEALCIRKQGAAK